MNKCLGCGQLTEKELCDRCFRIRHYNDYQVSNKTNDDYIPILKNIGKTKDLVVVVVDLFNAVNLKELTKYLNNDILLVLTKRDVLPKSVYDVNLLSYDYGINCVDKIIISSNKNYNFDLLYEKINEYKKSTNVYVVGYTNAGKSSMINKIIYNYSDNDSLITTSPIASTTLNEINININDELTLIDTPGILLDKDLSLTPNKSVLKKIVPSKEIKPTVFQVKSSQTIIIDEFAKIYLENINVTLYMSNNLKIRRVYKEDISEYKKVIYVDNEDIVIRGLGFISTKGKGIVTIYTNEDVEIYTRERLI